jgi:hypothetical protein
MLCVTPHCQCRRALRFTTFFRGGDVGDGRQGRQRYRACPHFSRSHRLAPVTAGTRREFYCLRRRTKPNAAKPVPMRARADGSGTAADGPGIGPAGGSAVSTRRSVGPTTRLSTLTRGKDNPASAAPARLVDPVTVNSGIVIIEGLIWLCGAGSKKTEPRT